MSTAKAKAKTTAKTKTKRKTRSAASAKKTVPQKKKSVKKSAAGKKPVKKSTAKSLASAKKAEAKKKTTRKKTTAKKVAQKKSEKKLASPTKAAPAKTTKAKVAKKKAPAKLASVAVAQPPKKISGAEYQRRRRALMDLMEPGSVAVLPSAKVRLRNRDVDYLFRQDSDFYYLTGFVEPNALLVLNPGRQAGEVVLFCAEREPRYEQVHGERLGPERAVSQLGVDDAFPITDVGDILPGMLEGRERIYSPLGEYRDFDRQLLGMVKDIRAREAGGAQSPGEFVALKHLLHEQRLYKSASELALMREAARISSAAHRRAMATCATGIDLSEGLLDAELTHEFMRNGARSPAYPSIVGGGANACVLHYVANAEPLKRGDLVLIDAGCEYQYYASDITRTFPVSGRFNASQRALYEVVLEANRQAIAACVIGNSFNDPHEVALRVMVQGLVDLKLLKGSVDSIIESGEYTAYCPHKSSHWLGIDVHDVGDYRIHDTWRELEPGMVLTIEPGIYLPAADERLAKRWRGMGIRIEDDVLITKNGPEVLTGAVPKDPDAIEDLMAGAI